MLAVAVAFGLGFVGYDVIAPRKTPPTIDGFMWPPPARLGEFELTDHRGAPFGLSRVRERWTLWYFGYTHCPDICPQTLTLFAEAGRALAAEKLSAPIQYVFVSVDPERDTLEHLSQYVDYFSPDLIGATADPVRLSTLATQLGVFFARNPPDANGDYTMDHTSGALLTDPEGRLLGLFRHPYTGRELAQRVIAIDRTLASLSSQN